MRTPNTLKLAEEGNGRVHILAEYGRENDALSAFGLTEDQVGQWRYHWTREHVSYRHTKYGTQTDVTRHYAHYMTSRQLCWESVMAGRPGYEGI